MDLRDAVDEANVAARRPPGWCARYIASLAGNGYRIVPQVGRRAPENSITAPIPPEGDPDAWAMPSVIVRAPGPEIPPGPQLDRLIKMGTDRGWKSE